MQGKIYNKKTPAYHTMIDQKFFWYVLLFLSTVLISACDNDSVIVNVEDAATSNSGRGVASTPEPTVSVAGNQSAGLDTDAASVFYPGDITDLVLITGQSNALGADTSFDVTRDGPHRRVFAYTDSGWQVADLHQVWDLNWHPGNHPETDPSNNFGFHFAKKVAERRSQKVVGFILATAPGEGISHWDYGSDFYLQVSRKVVAAINELPGKASIDGILWHQGETDWGATAYYENKLRELILNFRSEPWFSSDKPFICGETVTAPVNRLLMALNTDGDQYTGCVSSAGLGTILDGLHFSAEGLRILGTRYATKYLQIIEQP